MTDELPEAIRKFLEWAKTRFGSVYPAIRKKHFSIVYRYSLGGKKKSKTFLLRLDPIAMREDLEAAQSFIAAKDAAVYRYNAGYAMESAEADAPVKRISLYDLLKWYVDTNVKEIADRKPEEQVRTLVTIENNELSFKRFMLFLGNKDMPANEVETRHFHQYCSYLLQKNWLDRSVRADITRVQTIFKRAFEFKLIAEYRFHDFKMRRLSKARPRDILTLEEARAIAKTLKNKYVRLAWYIIMYTGMRGAEILRLQKEDIDFEKNEITVWMAKRGEFVTLPIHSRLMRMLQRFQGQRGPLMNFTNKTREKKLSNAFYLAIKNYKGGAFHLKGTHSLRHFFGHFCAQHGVLDQDIQFLLGHKIAGVTQIYTHKDLLMKRYHEIIESLPF